MKINKLVTSSLFILINISCFSQTKQNRMPDGIYHIVMYGQSLMLGTTSVPVISARQQYNTLMFSGGVRSGYDDDSTFYNSLVPLVEKQVKSKNTGTKLGETPASGCADEMISLLIKENKWVFDAGSNQFNHKIQLLFSSPAEGSKSVKDLSPEGEYWDRFKKDVTEGKLLAAKLGKAYNVPVILWNQGERDIDVRTSAEGYKKGLIALQLKADQFIKSVTHQTNTVRLILYQTSSNNVRKNRADNPVIANAQYELAKSNPYITMSNATYFLPYSGDNVHFTNVASKWNGAIHAVAAKKIIFDQQDWRPIFVKNTSIMGNNVDLNFNVPSPPLVFDTVAVVNPGNWGFRVFNPDGNELNITNITIAGNSVKISTDTPLKHGCYVWYGNNGTKTGAVNGSRGNLRDSQGDIYHVNIAGQDKRIDNWTPIFKEVL
jgi:hypothetical protein